MAGFDFEFASTPAHEALQRTLLQWMQQASQELGLQLRHRKVDDGFYVTLDGRLPEMEALPTYCYEGLDAIVAAFPMPKRRRDRQRVLERMLAVFERALADMVEAVNEVAGEMTAKGATVVPNSIDFDPGGKTHLDPSLKSFRHTLIRSYAGIPTRTLLEECHTVIEHLMAALFTPAERQKWSFEQQLDELNRRGVFDLPGAEDVLADGVPLEHQREVINGYFFEELKVPEIAARRDVSKSTIYNQKRHAEANLHDDDLFFSSLLGLEKVRDRARAERLAAKYPDGAYPGGKRIVHIEAA